MFVFGIAGIAATSRAPITSLAPLLESISLDFGLSALQIGFLTTLPLLAFALFSPLVAVLAHRYNNELLAIGALVAVAVGVGVRSARFSFTLYFGTCIAGVGIAFLNVLVPSLLKKRYPSKIALLTTFYVLCTTTSAAFFSALVVPTTQYLKGDWSTAILFLIILPLLSILLWLPQMRGPMSAPARCATDPNTRVIWKAALAWQVTVYFAFTSFLYYVAVAWFPAILIDNGYSPNQAGALHGLMQLAGAAPGLLLLTRFPRISDQRALAFISPLFAGIGLIGIYLNPAWAGLWIVVFGIGVSTALVLSLAFAGLRTTSTAQAASLSAMTQTVGYLFAAFGPPLIGNLHSIQGDWKASIFLCVSMCLSMAAIGLYAGRPIRL